MQQLQSLCFHGDREQTNSGDIAAWAIECRHRARFDRIIPRDEYDRNGRSRGPGSCCRRASPDQDDHSYAAIHQLSRLLRKSIVVSLRPAVFECDVATLNVAGFSQALLDCSNKARVWSRRHAAEDADHGYRRLLRPRRERPRSRRAAEKRDQLAAVHSITSSARASTLAGISKPVALAVLRLITSSYLVGACTGSSAGLSPLRMRSTYAAAGRYTSPTSVP